MVCYKLLWRCLTTSMAIDRVICSSAGPDRLQHCCWASGYMVDQPLYMLSRTHRIALQRQPYQGVLCQISAQLTILFHRNPANNEWPKAGSTVRGSPCDHGGTPAAGTAVWQIGVWRPFKTHKDEWSRVTAINEVEAKQISLKGSSRRLQMCPVMGYGHGGKVMYQLRSRVSASNL